ncbi:MAG: hypothetical protein ACPGYV_11620 [Phycisphaeraceae bacterium]
MNPWLPWHNPMVVRGFRTRLRLPLLVSWGIVTAVASVFLYVVVAGNAIKADGVTPQEAARDAILPLLFMQGLILMVLGTGSIAGGMARERTFRLLDYQRLTPMSPSAKIVGLLLGLPIREYFMFAVSLPFVFYAAWRGGLSFGILLQFYLVFLSSALVYHLTGLAAGVIVDKPWQAGTLSQGLVVVLYLALPQASKFGFTFFEYLTARPIFYGMVNQHLLPDGISGIVQGALQDPRYSSVAFFGLTFTPLVFSLLVQGFVMVALYVMIHRKWRDESTLSFSKTFAIGFYAVVQIFLVGSVYPFLTNDEMFGQLVTSYLEEDPFKGPEQGFVFAILLITLVVSGCMAILTVFLCTPSWYQSVVGLRRIVRKGGRRLRWDDDAASGLSVAGGCIVIAGIGFLSVYQTAVSSGRVVAENPLFEVFLPLVLFAFVLLTVQQVIEQFSDNVFVMFLFGFWIVPVLGFIVVTTAFRQPITGVYVGLFFPFFGLYMASALLMTDAHVTLTSDLMPEGLAAHASPVLALSLVLYTASAGLLGRTPLSWSQPKKTLRVVTRRA